MGNPHQFDSKTLPLSWDITSKAYLLRSVEYQKQFGFTLGICNFIREKGVGKKLSDGKVGEIFVPAQNIEVLGEKRINGNEKLAFSTKL
jgi:hypothetical protein